MSPLNPFRRLRPSEVRAHATALAIALWVVAAGVLLLGSRYRDPFDQLKWADFIQFYTAGDLTRRGDALQMYDPDALYARQVALVPQSAPDRYLPVYPPQIGLVFAPFSVLPYHLAAVVWTILGALVYAAALRSAWKPVKAALPEWPLVAIAALAFPGFWSMVLNGQATTIIIAAFAGGGAALAAGRRVLAGLVLGLLFVKPQFGLVLAVIVLACREWSMLAGLALSAATQAALVSGVMGWSVILDYGRVISRLPGLREALEPDPVRMHSIAALANLLPGLAAPAVWAAASVVVTWWTLVVWRTSLPAQVRMAMLALASLLVNPHVFLYDTAVLAAPLLSILGWTLASGRREAVSRFYGPMIYGLVALLLLPTARLVWIQFSVLILLWLAYRIRRDIQPA